MKIPKAPHRSGAAPTPAARLGNQDFVDEMSNRFGGYWQRGRPAKKPPQAKVNAAQLGLFAES